MLVDELKEAAEYGEVMHETTGTCKFCKQILAIRIPDTWDKDMANELAAEKCKCDGSYRYVTHKKRVEALDEALEDMFGEKSERDIEADTVELIRNIALDIIAGNLEKATIDIPPSQIDGPSEKLKIGLKKDGLYIGIEKKVSAGTLI